MDSNRSSTPSSDQQFHAQMDFVTVIDLTGDDDENQSDKEMIPCPEEIAKGSTGTSGTSGYGSGASGYESYYDSESDSESDDKDVGKFL